MYSDERVISSPSFVADHGSIVRDSGRQVDWEALEGDENFADAIPGGTVVVIQENGKVVPRAAAGAEPGPLRGILETTAERNARADALTGYGCIVGGAVYTGLMPDSDAAGDLPADYTTELNAAPNTSGFSFQTYTDTRAGG